MCVCPSLLWKVVLSKPKSPFLGSVFCFLSTTSHFRKSKGQSWVLRRPHGASQPGFPTQPVGQQHFLRSGFSYASKNTNIQTLVPPRDVTSIDGSGWLPPPPTNEWWPQSILHGCPCCCEATCPWRLLNLILIPKPFQFAVLLQVRSAQWKAVSYKRTRVNVCLSPGRRQKNK